MGDQRRYIRKAFTTKFTQNYTALIVIGGRRAGRRVGAAHAAAAGRRLHGSGRCSRSRCRKIKILQGSIVRRIERVQQARPRPKVRIVRKAGQLQCEARLAKLERFQRMRQNVPGEFALMRKARPTVHTMKDL